MQIINVCVLGGSGFVGSRVCEHLAARGYRVRVLTRSAERAKALTTLPTVELVAADVHDPATLRRALRGADAVVNLVGVLNDGRGRASFEQAHAGLARKVIAACADVGVARLLHMSAINADPAGPSAYLRSKGVAENEVRGSALSWTIFRPSVVFGTGDHFLNLFARMQRVLPVVPLAAADARFQPVYVEDVAAAFVRALERPDAIGQAYELCGPGVYTLRALVHLAGQAAGYRRIVFGLGPGLATLQAAVMERLPGKLLTRDNLRSMQRDAVCGCAFPFDIRPVALEAVLPVVFGAEPLRMRLQRLRDRR